MNHQHLIIKAYVKNPPKTVPKLNKWLNQLVKSINMKILFGPKSVYLDVPGNRGITGIVAIETSHCSIHVWDEEYPSLVQMDVYSCQEFDNKTVIDKLKEFDLIFCDLIHIDRNEMRITKIIHEYGDIDVC